ncbi:PREDICTED: interferon lambda receptor 1-like isoform X1 [Cyprinodon variegatus]|uniref:Interferon lambda receptor 1-like n=1 Tax=Cyprinodon variegatus TaxID=28743 RepID=A0A3Q2CNG1_CYPVA|nr:PREDICTED: interferon lambda receptor 1-like isoform X1 [Cyprinodon variegatus]
MVEAARDAGSFVIACQRVEMLMNPLIVLLLLLPPACASLPAPVNLRITSLNFQYDLHWDPGPGSPPGTVYRVSKLVKREKWRMLHKPTNVTSYRLELDLDSEYILAVRAKYNHSRSPRSDPITFVPLTETVFGPPTLSAVGHGTWIQVNISHPNITLIQREYAPDYKVLWKKENDGKIQEQTKTELWSFKLDKLEKGTEYCMQGHIMTRIIRNNPPSEWKCIFSSAPEPDNSMLVLVIAMVLLISLALLLSMGFFCLYYTGFLCKLKDLPAALMFGLLPEDAFGPKTVDMDQGTIFSQTVNLRNHPKATAPSTGEANSEDEDADEDYPGKLYVNRKTERSSYGGSQRDPEYHSGYLGKDARSSRGFTAEPPAEAEEWQVESDHREQKAGTVHDPDRSGLQVRVMTHHEEEMRTESQDLSGDVNLFSVTLASMATCDEGDPEEEQDSDSSSTDFLRIYTLNRSQTDSQRERDEQESAPLMEPPTEVFPDSGDADSWMDEEEEMSGYLTNR